MNVNAPTFRPLLRSDFPSLQRWFAQPHVAKWWNADPAPATVEAKYGPRVDGDNRATSMWIVEIEGVPCGLLQHYQHADHPDHDAAVGVDDAVGIDFLLSEEVTGRGVGPEALSAFAALVLEMTPSASCCVATPAQENRRSWRALERAGFVRHGTCQPPDEPPAFTYVRTR